MNIFWGPSKPPQSQYGDIRNGNYEKVAELIMNDDSIVDKESLLQSLYNKESGILRLLLMHKSANPNPILIEAINKDCHEHITALLESPNLSLATLNKVNPAIATACRKGMTTTVITMMSHPTFILYPEISHIYLNEAIKSQQTDLIKILLADKKFEDITKDGYLVISTACQYDTNIGHNILGMLLKKTFVSSALCKEILIECLIKKNENAFAMILNVTQNNGIKLGRNIVNICLSKDMISFFEILITYIVGDREIKSIIEMCIEEDKLSRLKMLLGKSKIDPEISHLIKSSEYRAVKCFDYLVERMTVFCGEYLCACKSLLSKHQDAEACRILNKFQCNHANSLAKVALNNYCWKSLVILLESPKISMVPDLTGRILVNAPEEIVFSVISKIDEVDDCDIYKLLSLGKYRIIHALLDAKAINIDWNDYALLKGDRYQIIEVTESEDSL